jgi:hypothetical protein
MLASDLNKFLSVDVRCKSKLTTFFTFFQLDGVMSVNLLHIIGTIFAQGQPARVIVLADTETPSPNAFLTAEESRNFPFGLREVLESNGQVFPEGLMGGVNPEYGINLTWKFFTPLSNVETNCRLYHPRLNVKYFMINS